MAFESAINLGNTLSGLFDKGWKKKVRPASFRGIPFYVLRASTSIGRRTKVYDPTETSKKFKNYKKTIIFDIGQRATRFTVEGYVIQANRNAFNYMEDRDKLIDALNTKGPGKLVHPFFGEKWVGLADQVEMEETFEEGGICRFTIPFVVADEKKEFPKSENALGLMDSIANSSILAAIDEFANSFNEAMSYANSLVDAVTGITQGVLDAINGVVGALSSVVNFVVNTVATLSALITNVLNAPCDIANAFKDMYNSLGDLCGMNGSVFTGGIISGCSSGGSSRSSSSTTATETPTNSVTSGPTAGIDSSTEKYASATGRNSGGLLLTGKSIPQDLGKSVVDALISSSTAFDEEDMSEIPEEQKQNVRAMLNLTKTLALTYGTQVAVRVDFDSKEQLEETTKDMIAAFDVLLTRLGDEEYLQPVNQIFKRVDADPDTYQRESTGSEVMFDIVQTVKTTFIRAMEIRKEQLAEEEEYYVPPGAVASSLVLAYDKYEDTARAEEIVRRNARKIEHPAFLPAGEILNILDE